MTISASEKLIRYLGPSEAYFWLSNQNSWKHFVVAAQITGETTTASWRAALDAVQRRHPLLGVCIDADDSGAPYFRLLPESPIPLQIVPGHALQGWEDEMETELSTPFPVEDALLISAVLLHEAHRATILLTMHHSIADGLSWVRRRSPPTSTAARRLPFWTEHKSLTSAACSGRFGGDSATGTTASPTVDPMLDTPRAGGKMRSMDPR
jgi:hypothetical protein